MTITYEKYTNRKNTFFRMNGEYKEDSRLIDNINRTVYMFENGAAWYEVSQNITETKDIEIHGITKTIDIDIYRLETWNTTNSESVYIYE